MTGRIAAGHWHIGPWCSVRGTAWWATRDGCYHDPIFYSTYVRMGILGELYGRTLTKVRDEIESVMGGKS